MEDCARKGRISLIGARAASKSNIGRKASSELCKIRSKNTRNWMNSDRSKVARRKIVKWLKTKECSEIRRKAALKQWRERKKACKNG